MSLIILGLGTNLGNREKNLQDAIALIKESLLFKITESSIYETKPMLPEGAPPEWNINYFNMAISGKLKNPATTPQEFLAAIKAIEAKLGRKESPRWSPREIDIDILAWGSEKIETDDLKIPHIGLMEREFTILPVAEISPLWVHPISGVKIGELAKRYRR